MRLRVQVLRHGLPAVDVLWNVQDNQKHKLTTISQLLEQVNEIIPLEAEDWGFEDYVVEVAGYECLHFSQLGQILKDEDVVVIRPLQTSEIRARTLGGRHQINEGGQHLIDGIPFGRPYLRRPNRPAVHIPPRKRRRLMFDDEEFGPPPALLPRYAEALRFAAGNEDDESQDDGDYVPEGADTTPAKARPSKRRKTVHFNDVGEPSADNALIQLPSDDEDERDEDFQDDSDTISSSDASDESTEKAEKDDRAHESVSEPSSDSESEELSTSSSDTSSFEESSEESSGSSSESEPESKSESETEEITTKAPAQKPPLSNKGRHQKPLHTKVPRRDNRSNAANGLKSVPGSNSASIRSRDAVLHKNKPGNPGREILSPHYPQSVPPGEGKDDTRARNQRRRDAKKLKLLKGAGILPSDADRSNLDGWRASHSGTQSPLATALTEPTPTTISTMETELRNSHRDSDPATTAQLHGSSVSSTSQKQEEFEKRRQELLDAIASGGVEVSAQKTGKTTKSAQAKPVTSKLDGDTTATSNGVGEERETEAIKDGAVTEPAPKRARLDVAGSRRLLFGSLGLRNPKTKADEEQTKAKLMELAKPQSSKKAPQKATDTVITEQESAEPEDSSAWRSKINLTAVECCDEGIELSEPPYPFKQRWDPQQQYYNNNSNGNSKSRKGKKRKRRASQYYEDHGHEFGYDDGEEAAVKLNYDDVEEADAVQSQLVQDMEMAVEVKDEAADDLPPVPANIFELPALKHEDLKSGTIIVFKQLECSQDTNWMPAITDFRTARVEKVDEDGVIQLMLAVRDRRQKEVQYDNKGNRVYNKFEMEGFEQNDDEDDGFRELAFSELVEPKILQGPMDSTEGDAGPGAEESGETSVSWNGIPCSPKAASEQEETALNATSQSTTPAMGVNQEQAELAVSA